MDYKTILTIIGIALSVISYYIYFRQIFKGQTKPHAFSWLVWALLTSIAFIAQITKGAGPAAWVVGSTGIACIAVFFIALFKGHKNFTVFDWVALLASLVSIALWKFTKDPTWSVILVTVIDAIGFLPTYRKSYYKPYEEGMTLYAISTIRYIFGLVALESFSISTWLFPASLVLTNGFFVLLLIIRRKQIIKN